MPIATTMRLLTGMMIVITATSLAFATNEAPEVCPQVQASLDVQPYLVQPEHFMARFTDAGWVYHGTSVANALSIIRSKKINPDQSFGFVRLFTTSEQGYASIHAFNYNDHGAVLSLRFRFRSDSKIARLVEHSIEHPTYKTFRNAGVGVVVTGPEHTGKVVFTDGNKIVVLDPDLLELPTVHKLLEDTAEDLKRKGKNAHINRVLAYKEMFENVEETEKLGLPDPKVFLDGRESEIIETLHSERY